MQMPGRHYHAHDYRFGYNGQEMDNEIDGNGNSLSFKYRIEDSRLGRFFSVDPLTGKFPDLSAYQFAGNTPIVAKDIEGLEPSTGWIGYSGFHPYATPAQQKQEQEALISGLKDDFFTWDGLKRSVGGALGIMGPLMGSAIAVVITEMATDGLGSRVAAEEIIPNSVRVARQSAADAMLTPRLRPSDPIPSTTVIPITNQRMALAQRFYQEAGFIPEKIPGHLNGIDFSKPVETITYKKGTQLTQWSYLDQNGNPKLGNYFTLPGENPEKLGIPLEGRVPITVTLTEDTKFLKSTTKTIENWNKPGSGQMLQGGGTQLFSTNAKYVVTKK